MKKKNCENNMKKKNCELCKESARLYCESDQASLCWACDFKVHAANFLVARHSRTLLCHVCQSPTPWTATGTKLGSTISVCRNCLLRTSNHLNGRAEYEDEKKNVDEKEGKNVEIDIEDNRVVQWSVPPPPSSSSSNNSDDEELYSSASSFPSSQPDRKKRRKNVSDLRLHENRCCTASSGNVNEPSEMAAGAVACGGGGAAGRVVDSVDSSSTRNLKRRRRESGRFGLSGSSSWAVVESVKRMQRQEMESAAAIAEFCRLSEDSSAVDCDSS